MLNTGENPQALPVGHAHSHETEVDYYLDAINLIERAHRNLLEVVKDDFERAGQDDMNPVQALMLFHMGSAEMSAGELRSRGHYLGSNVSYNLKKLVEAGYIDHKRCKSDKRAVRVKLTPKGMEIADRVAALFTRQSGMIATMGELTHDEMANMNIGLQRIERFWSDSVRFRL